MYVFKIVAFSLVALANGHAILNQPAAWNTQPSTRAPCGGATAAGRTPIQLAVAAGGTLNLDWQVVAGDGAGPVTVSIDPNGGTNFAVQARVTSANTNAAVGRYKIAATVPAGTVCGQTGCTLQVKSSSNWYSCSSINLQAAPTQQPTPKPTTPAPTEQTVTQQPTANPTEPTPKPTRVPTRVPTPLPKLCLTASNLNFCDMLNGKSVLAESNQQMALNDQLAANAFADDTANPKVFLLTTDTCKTNYKNVLCNKYLPGCTSSTTCKGNCQRTNACMDPSHAGLLNCEDQTIFAQVADNIGACAPFQPTNNNSPTNNSPTDNNNSPTTSYPLTDSSAHGLLPHLAVVILALAVLV